MLNPRLCFAIRSIKTKSDFRFWLENISNYKHQFLTNTPFLESINYDEFALLKICEEIERGKLYQSRFIPKRNGLPRQISVPNIKLKKLQKSINRFLQAFYQAPISATGFIPKKSIVTNAEAHKSKKYILNIDLHDFFFSIERERLSKTLENFFFTTLCNEAKEADVHIYMAELISKLTTFRIINESAGQQRQRGAFVRYVLPQGAPTSPILSNIVCLKMDYQLEELAKKFKAKFTRYADDISFSANNNIFKKSDSFFSMLQGIIIENGFRINKEKTRLQGMGYRREVTGLVISDKVNVHRRFIKQVRMLLYYWETYGYEKASELYGSFYRDEKGGALSKLPDLNLLLKGKLEFINTVRGKDDLLSKKLWIRYRNLNRI